MKKLPDEYIVKCDQDAKKCNKVYSNFYNDKFNPSAWKYIVCSPKINIAQFSGTGTVSASWVIEDYIRDEFAHLPVLTYKEWKKLKQMKKEIIGYRLVKPEYYKSASHVLYNHECGSFQLDNGVSMNHLIVKLRAAGVLDLWFEPVYREKEFEFGRWYKDGNYLYFIDNDRFYGFSCLGHWVNRERVGLNMKGWQPATDAEVKERLLAYAREKYPEGTRYKCAEDSTDQKVDDEFAVCDLQRITDGYGGYVLFNGKWAEIISEPEKKVTISVNGNALYNALVGAEVKKIKEAVDKLENIV